MDTEQTPEPKPVDDRSVAVHRDADDHVLLAPLERRLLELRGRRGPLWFVAVITAVSIVMSVALTAVISKVAGVSDEGFPTALLTGFLVPLLIAPVVSYGAGRMLGILNEVVDELDQLANVDALTGESNRRHFFAQAPAVIERCSAEGSTVLVGMVDIDAFKQVNDNLGHHTGDRVLVRLARQLRGACGEDAVIGRLGGDEFAVVVPGGDDIDALIRHIAAACRLVHVSETIDVHATVGLVDATGLDIDAALRMADTALYRRKEDPTGPVLRDADRQDRGPRP